MQGKKSPLPRPRENRCSDGLIYSARRNATENGSLVFLLPYYRHSLLAVYPSLCLPLCVKAKRGISTAITFSLVRHLFFFFFLFNLLKVTERFT